MGDHMSRPRFVVLPLVMVSFLFAACTTEDAQQAEGGRDSTVPPTGETGDSAACSTEVSLQTFLEAMPEEFAGLQHDPAYDAVADRGWSRFYQADLYQLSVDSVYYEEGDIYDVCPGKAQRAAQELRTFAAKDYQRQQEEHGQEVLPFEELDFEAGGRYFACAKNPAADLRQFFCATSVGNVGVLNYMFRHSKGDAEDVEDMKQASSELAAIIDQVPVGPGLADS